MKLERIDEIAEYYDSLTGISQSVKEWFVYAIKEAIEEENRWYYPEKGELPEHSTKDIIALMKAGSVCIGETRYAEFYCNEWQRLVKWERVLRWRYVPEVPGGEDD